MPNPEPSTIKARCPQCNCADSLVLAAGSWFGGPWERRQCRHCRKIWRGPAISSQPSAVSHQEPVVEHQEPPAPLVRYVRVKCPQCGGGNCPVTSTRGRNRHHKCKGCGNCFKSVEVD